MTKIYYDQDWESEPPLRPFYFKYTLAPTGRDIPTGMPMGEAVDDYVQEFEMETFQRISKEEYAEQQ